MNEKAYQTASNDSRRILFVAPLQRLPGEDAVQIWVFAAYVKYSFEQKTI